MELIRELYEKDIDMNLINHEEITYKLRKASRAIVLNEEGKMALLYVSKDKYHKLPGGGVEMGENIMEALERELMEEVGVKAEVSEEIGTIIEYRDKFKLLQISYCYAAKVDGTIRDTAFTDTEKEAGFILQWVEVDQAVQLLEQDFPENYLGRFIRERDLAFLRKYKWKIEGRA